MQFDRYRAYAAATGTRSKLIKNEDGSIPLTDDGEIKRTIVDEWDHEEVAFEGEPAGDGTVSFDAGQTVITKVVAYRGPADGESVAGSIEVGKSGKISVKFD